MVKFDGLEAAREVLAAFSSDFYLVVGQVLPLLAEDFDNV
jgi:hypothetical protein